MSEDRRGCLWVADISGYTNFLNESELAHAEGTLTELLKLLIEKPGSPLRVSKLEGDAVFAYAFEDELRGGQAFLEMVEDTYYEFRRAIELMVLNNTCQCNACANVSSLDLKFVIHHGEFRIQQVSGFAELLGADVNLVHRLMKNSVIEKTGITAYCLYTDEAMKELSLSDVGKFIEGKELVADFGSVSVWIQDLSETYAQRRSSDRIELTDDETLFTISVDLPMSSPEAWFYVGAPEFRALLGGSDRQVVDEDGRIGAGTVYQCYHGNQVVPQVVLEWEPFERVVTEETWIKPWKASSIAIVELTEIDGGTRLTKTYGRIKGSKITITLGKTLMNRVMKGVHTKNLEAFAEAVVSDWQKIGRAEPSAAIAEESVIAAARSGLANRAT